jgi:hypothetical protein
VHVLGLFGPSLHTVSGAHAYGAQVVREFARPEGVAAEEMGAIAEAELMAVLDLRPDEALREAGLAREVVNRVQKLRKKAGLLVGAPASCIYCQPSHDASQEWQQISITSCVLPLVCMQT